MSPGVPSRHTQHEASGYLVRLMIPRNMCDHDQTSDMSRLDDLISRRTENRRRVAEAAAGRVLDALHAKGIDIRLFGSLVRGGFKNHSDVDFLVRGQITPDIRVTVESTIARVLGETDLPYDVIYLDDLTAAQAAAFDRAALGDRSPAIQNGRQAHLAERERITTS